MGQPIKSLLLGFQWTIQCGSVMSNFGVVYTVFSHINRVVLYGTKPSTNKGALSTTPTSPWNIQHHLTKNQMFIQIKVRSPVITRTAFFNYFSYSGKNIHYLFVQLNIDLGQLTQEPATIESKINNWSLKLSVLVFWFGLISVCIVLFWPACSIYIHTLAQIRVDTVDILCKVY